MGIRFKLLLPVLLALCIFAIILHFFWFKYYVENEHEQFIVHQQEVLSALAPGLTGSILAGDFASIFTTLDRQMEQKEKDWRTLKLVNNTGKRIYPLEDIPNFDVSNNSHLSVISFPIKHENVVIASAHLLIDWTEGLKQTTKNRTRLELAAFVIFLSINLTAVLWQSNWVRKPILVLEKAAESLEKGDYSEQLPKASNDELGRLTSAFKSMRNELEHSRYELEARVLERTKQLEEAREKAEEANQAKSGFLSSMSHELRTPLNAILGFGQLLEKTTPPLSKENLDGVKEILEAGNHLLVLINQVLDLAKIESGHLSLNIVSVNTSDAIKSALQMVSSIAGKNHIDLCYDEQDADIHVFTDIIRLRQILINLLSNAIKYNKVNGVVTVNCEIMENGFARIIVEDTGFGIASHKLNKLFNPFERLGADMGKIEGSGIGLSVSKSLIEAMGGKIGVDSTEGSGSVFWIEIPIAIQKAMNDMELDNSKYTIKQNQHQKLLLYIEDNLSNQKLVKQMIDQFPNYELLIAPNGEKGLKIAEQKQPDLILLDINLPDINGDIVFARLKENSTTENIPVIALTANAMENDIQKGTKIGFDDYITKPINISELLNTIQFHCNSHK